LTGRDHSLRKIPRASSFFSSHLPVNKLPLNLNPVKKNRPGKHPRGVGNAFMVMMKEKLKNIALRFPGESLAQVSQQLLINGEFQLLGPARILFGLLISLLLVRGIGPIIVSHGKIRI
jgi:hypothetical protein